MSDKKNNGEEYSLRESADELELDDDTISVQSFNTDIFSDDSSIESSSDGSVDSEAASIIQVPNNRGAEELNLEPLRVAGRGMAERLRIIGATGEHNVLDTRDTTLQSVFRGGEDATSQSNEVMSTETDLLENSTSRAVQASLSLLESRIRQLDTINCDTANHVEEYVPIREGVGGLRDVIHNPDQGGFTNRIGRQSSDIEIRRSDAFDEDEQSLGSDGTNTTPRSPRDGNRSR